MSFDTDLDWEEAFIYRPGEKVELKSQPGTFDIIASYELTMVPPIWLVNDPRPRYAHELRLIAKRCPQGGIETTGGQKDVSSTPYSCPLSLKQTSRALVPPASY